MGRPPIIPPEKKTRIVLAILSGEMSMAEAARHAPGARPPSGTGQYCGGVMKALRCPAQRPVLLPGKWRCV
jgi:hypothetical protein